MVLIACIVIAVCIIILSKYHINSIDGYISLTKKERMKTAPYYFASCVCDYLNKHKSQSIDPHTAIEAVRTEWESKKNYYTTDYDAFHKLARFTLVDPDDPNCKWTCLSLPKSYSKEVEDRLRAWQTYNMRRVKRQPGGGIKLTYIIEEFGFMEYVQPEINNPDEPLLKYYIPDLFFEHWVGDGETSHLDMVKMNTIWSNVLPVGTIVGYLGTKRKIKQVIYNDKHTKAYYILDGIDKKVNIFRVDYEDPYYIKSKLAKPHPVFLKYEKVTGDKTV